MSEIDWAVRRRRDVNNVTVNTDTRLEQQSGISRHANAGVCGVAEGRDPAQGLALGLADRMTRDVAFVPYLSLSHHDMFRSSDDTVTART